jgi:hypothetical protein
MTYPLDQANACWGAVRGSPEGAGIKAEARQNARNISAYELNHPVLWPEWQRPEWQRPENQNGPLPKKRAVLGATPKVLVGGAREDRTPDLLNAIQALSHLSYDPAGKTRAMGGAMPGI